MAPTSPNFGYLAYVGAPIVEAAARAEQVLLLDPVGAMQHLQRFGELLARSAAARLGLEDRGNEEQMVPLRRLEQTRIADNGLTMFHSLRREGNRAAHDLLPSSRRKKTISLHPSNLQILN